MSAERTPVRWPILDRCNTKCFMTNKYIKKNSLNTLQVLILAKEVADVLCQNTPNDTLHDQLPNRKLVDYSIFPHDNIVI